jgi:hypothetical protein
MNRSIDVRLKKLEATATLEAPSKKVHLFAAQTDAERDAKIAELVAAGAGPDDLFIQLLGADFPADHPRNEIGLATETGSGAV